MSLALQNSVDIELLIEGSRNELFEKITSHDSFSDRRTSANYDEPVTFCIQRSYLSNDGSERIFEVKFDNFEHFYYAFEFKGYVLCPAFLVSMFDLTDYACLDVRNGTHYYYIFLSRKEDDPLPKILNEQFDSDFLGDFELRIPSDEHKLLLLNSTTKDFKCFIFSPDDEALCKEYHGFGNKPSDTLMESEIVPSYWFATQKLRDLFMAKHTLFPYKFAVSNVRVHEDSKSFAEFQEIMKPNTEEGTGDVNISIVSSESIFTATKYKREDYILNSFADHLRRNFKFSSKRKVKDYYCSMIAVLQSSGYGKSRLMDRFGGRTPTFYSSLQPGGGFPGKSFFLARLIEELDRIVIKYIYPSFCHMNNVSTAVYIYILRMLFVILNSSDNNPLKNTFKIDSEIEGHKFFKSASDDESEKREEIFKILFNGLEDICKYNASVIFNGTVTLKLKDIPMIQKFFPNKFAIGIYSKEVLTCDLEGDVMKMLEKLGVKGLPSLFVIDEAHGLQYKGLSKDEKSKYNWEFRDMVVKDKKYENVGKRSPYNVFRRVFRIFTYTWDHVVLILISTSGQISVLLPDWKLDPSWRPQTSIRFIENFALVQTFSVHSETAQTLTAEKFTDWNEFLKSKDRIIEYFKLGRPLIYGIFLENVVKDRENYDLEAKFEYDLEAKFDDCGEFKFVAVKLFGGKEYGLTGKIGLLFGMLNFAFGTDFLPSYVSKEDLIENHLMTMVEFLNEHDASYIVGGFLPEGVINFLSARYFVQFPESLIKVFDSSVKCGLCDIGNFGELLAQFILLRNIFKCIDDSFQKVRKLVFQPVFLKDFLLQLAGARYKSVVNKYFKINDLLKGSQISFGYFEHFPEKPIVNPFDLMARFLFRGSATTLNGYYPAIDLLIPLVLGDKGISFVAIQVKYISKSKDVDSSVNKALMKMNFRNMFPNCHPERQNELPFASIILVIGKYPLKVSIQKQEGLEPLEKQDYSKAPLTLVFSGLQAAGLDLHDIAPANASYHGMDPKYLKKCDRMHDLTREIPQKEMDQRLEAQQAESEDPNPKPPRLDKSPEAQEAKPSSKRAQKSQSVSPENAAGPGISKGIVPKAKRSKSPEAKPSPKRAKKSQSDSSGDAAGPSISKGTTAHPKPRERKNK